MTPSAPPVRLFCIPYSGASAAVYARWSFLVPDAIAIHPVELPGRGTRADEPFAADPHHLAEALAKELADLHRLADPAVPYALFGHSLGALVAYELAHALIRRGAAPPRLLVASGTSAPAMRDDRAWRRPRSDTELIADLRAMGGTPEEVIASPELMEMVLPVLRADFLMCGAYAFRPRPPLPCPIRVLGGEQDDVPGEALEGWRRETATGFGLSLFPGGHFFIQAHQGAVLDRISRDLIACDLAGHILPEAHPDGPCGRKPGIVQAAAYAAS
ncbi:thioesterase II family protein [Methylobacterium aquaticum]|uniref:thioesterase II family protein n=1 Tax=Methylobacterium aquaticum TaxID=270351 RepID=UPI003D163CF3